MSITTQLKLKQEARNLNKKNPSINLTVEPNTFIETLAQISERALASKAPKKGGLNKKLRLEDEEPATLNASDGSLTGPAGSGNAADQEGGQALVYAQSTEMVSDASTSSSSATDLSAASETVNTPISTAETGTGLSTAQMIALGALGVAAVGGGVVAITSSGSNGSSSADTTPPQINSLSVNGNTITLTYSENLDAHHLPATSAFTVSSGGSINAVTGLAVNGNTITLTLANSIASGAIVSLTYTDPSAGNDVNAIQDTSGNDASGFIQGIVADGYIRDAKIYIDANGDGIAQDSEFTGVTTNNDGSFFLPNTLPNGAIIAVGGINIDTGIPQTTPLTAPAGSATINPLTTLIQTMLNDASRAGVTLSSTQASDIVVNALGITLPTGQTLLNYDPLAGSDVAAQKAAAQVATLLALGSNGDSARSTQIQSKISGLIRQQNNVDLTDPTTLNSILMDADHSANDIATLAASVASANASIQSATDFAAITTAQSLNLDTVVPFPATILNQPLYQTSQPVVRIQLNKLNSTDGSAPVVGDRLELKVTRLNGEALSDQIISLSKTDLMRGYMDVVVNASLPDGKSLATVAVLDKANQTSASNDLAQYTSTTILLVDTGAPVILSVDATSSSGNVAHLVAGDIITINVAFDEPVSVIGNPTILIQIGGHSVNAHRVAGQGSDYELIFNYTVQTGETGQLAVGTDCIQLNGGSILGAQNEAPNLILPTAPVVPGGFVFTHIGATPLDATVSESGSASTYQVALSTQPTENVTLYLESSSAKEVSLSSNGTALGVKALTFTPLDWNTPQSFYVSATDTSAPDAGSTQGIYARSQSVDPTYNNLLFGNSGKAFTVTETADNGDAVLAVLQTAINLNDANTTNDQLDIHLNYQPTSNVYVTVHGTGGSFLIDGKSTVTDTTLIFTPQNWSQNQHVAISAVTSAISGTNSSTPAITIKSKSDDSGFTDSIGTLISVTPSTATTTLSNALPTETAAGWLPMMRGGVEAMVEQFAAVKYPLLGELSASTIKSVVDGVMADITAMATGVADFVTKPGNTFQINTGTHEFYVRLQDTVDLLDVALAKDLGFGSAQTSLLAFNLNADASLDLGYDLVLEGGWDGTNVYFDAATTASNGVQGSCLLLDLGAHLTGNASGSIGPLNVTVADKPSTNAEMKGLSTGMNANVDVYLQDGRNSDDGKLTLAEMSGLFTGAQSLNDCFSVDMGLSGQVSLGVNASLDLGSSTINAFIPDFSFDLNAPFGVQLVHNVTDNAHQAAWFSNLLPTPQSSSQTNLLTKSGNIYLDNLTIGLGDFISQFVAPVVNAADGVVQLLAPVQTLLEYDLADTNNINVQPYEADLSLSSWGIGDFLNPFGKVGKEYLKQLGSNLITNFVNGIIEDLNFDTTNDEADRITVTVLEVITGIINDLYTKEEASHSAGSPLTAEQQTAHLQAAAAKFGVDALNTLISFMDGFNVAKTAMAASNASLTDGINLGSVTIPLLNLASTATSDSQIYQPAIVAHEGSGGEIPAFLTEIVSDLENLGFAFPILTDGTSLVKVLTLQPVDLATFTPDIPDIHDLQIDVPILSLTDLLVSALPILAPIKSWIPLTGGLDFVTTINVDSNVTVGVDTSGIINWFKDGMGSDLASLATLADGFFISDNLSTVNDQSVDLPEISAQIDAGIKALLGVGGTGWGFGASGSAGFGVDASIALDLVDGGELSGTSDGNVHLGEILQNLNQSTILDSLASALDVNGTIGAYMNAELSAYLNLSDNSVIQGMATADKWLGWLESIPVLSTLISAGGFIADLADVVPRVDVTLAATSSTIEIPYTVL